MITWHPPLSWHNHEPSLVCIPPDDDNNDDDFDDVCIADDNKSDLIIPTLIILPITFLIVRIIVLNKFPFIWFLVPRPTVGHPPLQSPLIESLFGKTTIIIIFHSRALYHRCMYVCGTPEEKHQRGKAFPKIGMIWHSHTFILSQMTWNYQLGENLGPQSLALPVKVLSSIESLIDASMMKDKQQIQRMVLESITINGIGQESRWLGECWEMGKPLLLNLFVPPLRP